MKREFIKTKSFFVPTCSCRTVALMVLGQFSDICRPQGYGFHPIKNFRNCTVKKLCCFFANFCHEIVCENDQTYIFRFVRYLSTFFYTYLPINIRFQLVIITNVSILTDPAYFVLPSCHCGNIETFVMIMTYGPQISENWPRTIRATVPQLLCPMVEQSCARMVMWRIPHKVSFFMWIENSRWPPLQHFQFLS